MGMNIHLNRKNCVEMSLSAIQTILHVYLFDIQKNITLQLSFIVKIDASSYRSIIKKKKLT